MKIPLRTAAEYMACTVDQSPIFLLVLILPETEANSWISQLGSMDGNGFP